MMEVETILFLFKKANTESPISVSKSNRVLVGTISYSTFKRGQTYH